MPKAERALVEPTNTKSCGVPIERFGPGSEMGFRRRLNGNYGRRRGSLLAVGRVCSSY
jgi:hypothetical protein